jgi:hypothetical protein
MAINATPTAILAITPLLSTPSSLLLVAAVVGGVTAEVEFTGARGAGGDGFCTEVGGGLGASAAVGFNVSSFGWLVGSWLVLRKDGGVVGGRVTGAKVGRAVVGDGVVTMLQVGEEQSPNITKDKKVTMEPVI